jgi:hypothetical protein
MAGITFLPRASTSVSTFKKTKTHKAISRTIAGTLWEHNMNPELVLQQAKLTLRRMDGRNKVPGRQFEARHYLELAVAKYLDQPQPSSCEVGVHAARYYRLAIQAIDDSNLDSWGAGSARRRDSDVICAAGFLVVALAALRKARARFDKNVFSRGPHKVFRRVQQEFDHAVDLMRLSIELEGARHVGRPIPCDDSASLASDTLANTVRRERSVSIGAVSIVVED